MEVEIKFRLPNHAAHHAVSTLLLPFHRYTHHQENLFFDGAAGELSSRRAVLRLRFYEGDARCVISLKARAVLTGGVSRVEEDEEELDPVIGWACVKDQVRLGLVESRVIARARIENGVGDGGFVCLGGFKNTRDVFHWNGLILEVDETMYAFGTCYEIECETDDPERVKKSLEEFLKENGISYSYSEASMFATFRSGMLPL